MDKRYLFLLLATLAFPAKAQFNLDAEGGVVFGTNYNKVRIPNSGGTLFNLASELEVSPKVFYRIRAGYAIAKRHHISALYAPLSVQYKGSFDRIILFNDRSFVAGQPVHVTYKFNSYRLTYRYDFISNTRWILGAGLTAKIRDADIRLKSENADTHYDNVGFVPLVNFYAAYRPSYRWSFILEGDALASKQGRAEDVFAGIAYHINSQLGVKLGYRVVEGGADSDKIYNFNWINYASIGVLASF